MPFRVPWFTVARFLLPLLAALLVAALIEGCKRKPVTPPPGEDRILCLLIGGKDKDQLDDLYAALQARVPGAAYVRFSPEDGYRTDVAAYVANSKYHRLVLIGHSWGCARIAADAARIARVDLAVFYDPVDFLQGAYLAVPSTVDRVLVFPRTTTPWIIPVSARVHGPAAVEVVPLPGGHSDGCHDPASFDRVVQRILDLDK